MFLIVATVYLLIAAIYGWRAVRRFDAWVSRPGCHHGIARQYAILRELDHERYALAAATSLVAMALAWPYLLVQVEIRGRRPILTTQWEAERAILADQRARRNAAWRSAWAFVVHCEAPFVERAGVRRAVPNGGLARECGASCKIVDAGSCALDERRFTRHLERCIGWTGFPPECFL